MFVVTGKETCKFSLGSVNISGEVKLKKGEKDRKCVNGKGVGVNDSGRKEEVARKRD